MMIEKIIILLLLFIYRLSESIIIKKSESNTIIDIPNKFLTDRYPPIGSSDQSSFDENTNQLIDAKVEDMSIPGLKIPMSLGRHEQFSLFLPRHRQIADGLIEIFLSLSSIDDLQSVAAYAKDQLNSLLFNYVLSKVLLHHPDTNGLDLPSFVETFPDKYVVPDTSRIPIIIPRDYTASDLDEEHRLWYFREDMGVNLHHWHWHLVYPFEASDRAIVAKDRRGELFYYMHQQIVARYNLERFSNKMSRVKRLNDFREPIPEGYFPKLGSLVASRTWPSRFANANMQDLNREQDQIKLDVADLERWRDRLYEAIHQGFVVDESGNRTTLDENTGIDILGNMIESSILSPNRQLYGDLHNMGLILISYIHDPDYRYLESFGVIGDSATAMRDPVFYRWNAFVDDVFQEHKESLTPYNQNQLDYRDITITGVQVNDEGESGTNSLQTFWQQSDIDFSRGMDFVPRGNVFARVTHLQHTEFTYTININNARRDQRFGTVRIFLGPKTDERGQPMLLRDQRQLMVELDRFIVSIQPGENTIIRRSNESSVTIPFERTFRNLDANRPAAGAPEELEFNFCGCGWPQHMLIPKGLPQGLRCKLFVMVSNFDDDRVDQDLLGTSNDASSFCGVRNRLYPDRRPMGFPFDRLPPTGVHRLTGLLTPNMRVIDVKIIHTDRTTVRIN